jgi:hypothetical protein
VELGLARAAALGTGFAALGFAGLGGGAVGFGSVDFGLGGAFVWHGLSPTFIILVCQLNIDLFLIVLLKMKEIYFCEWCDGGLKGLQSEGRSVRCLTDSIPLGRLHVRRCAGRPVKIYLTHLTETR